MALSEKHELFALEYIKDLNAAQAAIRAGYSERTARTQGSRLMTNADIRARIDELMGKRKEELNIDAEFVLSRLVEVSEMCLQAKPVTKWNYAEKKLEETGEYMFDSTGANRALELLGKHLGLFKDKIEHSGEMNIKVALPEGFGDDDDN